MKVPCSCSSISNPHVPSPVSFSSPGFTKCLLLSPLSDRDRRRKKSMGFQHKSSAQSSAITYSWSSVSTAKSGHWYLSRLTPDLMISAPQRFPPKYCWAKTRYAGWYSSNRYCISVIQTCSQDITPTLLQLGNSFHGVKGQIRLGKMKPIPTVY